MHLSRLTVRSRVKLLALQKGIETLTELARLIGIAIGTLKHAMRMKSTHRKTARERIANFLEVPAAELFAPEPAKPPRRQRQPASKTHHD